METIDENLSVSQLLKIISEFSKFLEHGNQGIREILQHLNLRSFATFECQSVQLTLLDSKNELYLHSIYGNEIPKEYAGTQKFTPDGKLSISLDDKLPIIDVIQSGKIMWINTLPDWGVDYPILKEFPIDFHGQTFICIPLVDRGMIIGGLSLVCGPQLIESDIFNDFFTAITGLMSLSISKL